MHGSFILAAAAMVGIVAASPAPQAVTTPSPTPIPLGNFGPYGNETYINCSITYNSCIVSQSAAYCATQYSNCLGYNPFTTTSSEPITSARLTLSLSSSSTSPTSYALGAKTGSSSSSSTSPTSYALGAKTGSYSSSPSKSPTSYAMGLKIPSSSSSSSSTSTSYAKGLVIPSTTTQSETVFTTTTVCPVTSTGTSGSSVYTSTYLTTSTITITSCKGGCSPIPTPTGSSGNATYDACTAAFRACGVAPFANQATCVDRYSACLGYYPFTSSSTSPPAPTGTPANVTADACLATFRACGAAPFANQATCVDRYSACLGYYPFTSSSTSPPAPTGTPANVTADACLATFRACGVAPFANQATCVDRYSACLGYYPFTSTTSAPAPTGTPANVTYDACTAAFKACSYAADANHAYCVATYSGCLGYNPFSTPTTTVAPPTATPDACTQKYNECNAQSGNSPSICAAQYKVCLGYSPGGYGPVPPNVTYTTQIVTSFTTYCPSPTTITTNGKTYTVTSATTLTITDCPCTITKPVLPPTPISITKPVLPPTTKSVTNPALPPTTISLPTPVTVTDSTFVTTQYTTLTTFVPCSTPVSSSGSKTFYSTWLTVSYSTSSSVYTTSTVVPPPVIATSVVSSPTSYYMGAVIPTTSVIPPAGQTCPTATVTVTVTVAPVVPAPTVCSSCHVETTTITLSNGYTTCLTITATPTSTSSYVPGQPQSWTGALTSTSSAPATGAIFSTGAVTYATGAVIPTAHRQWW